MKDTSRWRGRSRLILAVLIGVAPLHADEALTPSVILVGSRGLQDTLDRAAPHSIVMCNRNTPVTLSTPIRIQKPLTLRGLNARLPDELGKTPLVIVESEGVTVTDFELHGNADTVPQVDRAPLLIVSASRFRILNGLVYNSSKDGVMIDCTGADGQERDVSDGVVRDITGHNIVRDVVSISGGENGSRVRHVLVENVRCYGSKLRGTVEVSDGTDNITVRKVYAEHCAYAVDVQDHGQSKQVNTNIVIQGVHAKQCTVAIRTANRPFGHSDLTIRDVIAEHCQAAILLRNTDRLVVNNIHVRDHGTGVPVTITNCDIVSLTDVFFVDAHPDECALRLEDCNDVRVHGVTYRGALTKGAVINYRVASNELFSGVQIGGVNAVGVRCGVLLDKKSKKGGLTDYIITRNLAPVVDHIQGDRRVVVDNTF